MTPHLRNLQKIRMERVSGLINVSPRKLDNQEHWHLFALSLWTRQKFIWYFTCHIWFCNRQLQVRQPSWVTKGKWNTSSVKKGATLKLIQHPSWAKSGVGWRTRFLNWAINALPSFYITWITWNVHPVNDEHPTAVCNNPWVLRYAKTAYVFSIKTVLICLRHARWYSG